MIRKPPGIEDIFPDRTPKWNFIINTAIESFNNYNYKEIIIPILEFSEVFISGLGSETDIVTKEMFTLKDRGGRSLTLRPEGTASAVRAYIENGDYHRLSSCKFFYNGPMFRAERPQKGRLRQFNQFGAELFGSPNPYYDYEIISLMNTIAKKLQIKNYSLLINSIGCSACRMDYNNELKSYYIGHSDKLCNDCKIRLEKNPLRLLDCKNESCTELKKNAPIISGYLCDECKDHHSILKDYLDMTAVDYIEDAHLVRGLDYYTKTTFEFVSTNLGGQNAFAAGGRYDNLVESFGGKPTPAVGFAAGVERIFMLTNEQKSENTLDLFLIHSGDNALHKLIELSEILRANKFSVDLDPNSRGFKSQFKKANRENAKFTIIIGEEELSTNMYTIKNLQTGKQEKIDAACLIDSLTSLIS